MNTCHRMIRALLALTAAALLLSGCGQKPPGCADQAVQDTVREIFLENMRTQPNGIPSKTPVPAAEKEYLDALKFGLSTITSEGVNATAKSNACRATLSLETAGNVRGTKEIEYVVQLTEDKPGTFVVRVADLYGLVNGVLGDFYVLQEKKQSQREAAAQAEQDAKAGWPQCIYVRQSDGTIFDAPRNNAVNTRQLLPAGSYRATGRDGAFLHVTGSADSAPFADGQDIGWVMASYVEFQDLRNCN